MLRNCKRNPLCNLIKQTGSPLKIEDVTEKQHNSISHLSELTLQLVVAMGFIFRYRTLIFWKARKMYFPQFLEKCLIDT